MDRGFTIEGRGKKCREGSLTQKTPGGEVLVYRSPDGRAHVEVRLDRETVWLSLNQMVDLFGRDKSVISRHLKKVFTDGELARKSVVAKNATTGPDGKTYQVDYYNLDVIISVGYRVNSKRGVQFRQWATGVLRDFLIKGYALNQIRLNRKSLEEAQNTLLILSKTLNANALLTAKGRAVLDVVTRYAGAWRLLRDFDEGRLPTAPSRSVAPLASFSTREARGMAAALRDRLALSGEAGSLFGQERGKALERIIGSLAQTFGGQILYPSAQARAAHLFYFVIKDHPFSDGNKRIASLFFLEYLGRSGLLLTVDGKPRFAGNAVVALALLIAESDPKQKETMVRLILNLLEDE